MTLHQEQLTAGSGQYTHECKKKYCYYCDLMYRKPREQTVMKPILARHADVSHERWTGSELGILVNNCLLSLAELCELIPTRTKSAIIKMRCEKAKEWGIKYIAREWRWVNA